uniref:Uncharacterized protein n=1 Tax=Polytomella parva TaxID=51329 RepID=A0A7S0VKB1_9CHLO
MEREERNEEIGKENKVKADQKEKNAASTNHKPSKAIGADVSISHRQLKSGHRTCRTPEISTHSPCHSHTTYTNQSPKSSHSFTSALAPAIAFGHRRFESEAHVCGLSGIASQIRSAHSSGGGTSEGGSRPYSSGGGEGGGEEMGSRGQREGGQRGGEEPTIHAVVNLSTRSTAHPREEEEEMVSERRIHGKTASRITKNDKGERIGEDEEMSEDIEMAVIDEEEEQVMEREAEKVEGEKDSLKPLLDKHTESTRKSTSTDEHLRAMNASFSNENKYNSNKFNDQDKAIVSSSPSSSPLSTSPATTGSSPSSSPPSNHGTLFSSSILSSPQNSRHFSKIAEDGAELQDGINEDHLTISRTASSGVNATYAKPERQKHVKKKNSLSHKDKCLRPTFSDMSGMAMVSLPYHPGSHNNTISPSLVYRSSSLSYHTVSNTPHGLPPSSFHGPLICDTGVAEDPSLIGYQRIPHVADAWKASATPEGHLRVGRHGEWNTQQPNFHSLTTADVSASSGSNHSQLLMEFEGAHGNDGNDSSNASVLGNGRGSKVKRDLNFLSETNESVVRRINSGSLNKQRQATGTWGVSLEVPGSNPDASIDPALLAILRHQQAR